MVIEGIAVYAAFLDYILYAYLLERILLQQLYKSFLYRFFVKEGIGTTPYRYMYIIICILYPPCAAQSTARTAETGGDHITSSRFFVRFMVKSKEKAVLI